jgi:hypothetical protein
MMSNLGVGLDVGTMNLVAGRFEGDKVVTKRMRDAFLDLPKSAQKVLKLSKAAYVERGDELLLLGDQALELAAVFGREARRPLSGGLIAAGELEAMDVLAYMIKELLGAPKAPGEHCYYSVPAAPVDNLSRDVIYHKRVFEKIVTQCGYTATPSNEAMAIIYAEAAKDNFSALSFSFGSGMTNIALGYAAVETMAFSVERGGDWIDGGAARSVGTTASRMCSIKEEGIDLANPKTREQEAISYYYRELISYTLEWTANEFKRRGLGQTVTKPLPIIVSGGTSTAKGFLDIFKSVLDRQRKKLGLEVTEVRAAAEPFDAVARGLLVQANQEHSE